jgi:hypothetical protein
MKPVNDNQKLVASLMILRATAEPETGGNVRSLAERANPSNTDSVSGWIRDRHASHPLAFPTDD